MEPGESNSGGMNQAPTHDSTSKANLTSAQIQSSGYVVEVFCVRLGLRGNDHVVIFCDRPNIIGLILTKDLLNYVLEDSVPISSMRMRPLPRLSAATPMYDMLKLFQTGRSHMAVLTQPSPLEGQSVCGRMVPMMVGFRVQKR